MELLVAVVDDDISVRESLESLIPSVGLAVKVYASAEQFLNSAHPRKADCLALNVRLLGMSGLEFHRHLSARDRKVPLFSSRRMHPMTVDRARSEASADWTAGYLTKPFSEDELLDAVHAVLNWKPEIKAS